MRVRINRYTIAFIVLNEVRGIIMAGPILLAWLKTHYGI
jgi:hypothetical protein